MDAPICIFYVGRTHVVDGWDKINKPLCATRPASAFTVSQAMYPKSLASIDYKMVQVELNSECGMAYKCNVTNYLLFVVKVQMRFWCNKTASCQSRYCVNWPVQLAVVSFNCQVKRYSECLLHSQQTFVYIMCGNRYFHT